MIISHVEDSYTCKLWLDHNKSPMFIPRRPCSTHLAFRPRRTQSMERMSVRFGLSSLPPSKRTLLKSWAALKWYPGFLIPEKLYLELVQHLDSPALRLFYLAGACQDEGS